MGVGPQAIVRLVAAAVAGLEVAAATAARRTATQFIGAALVAAIVDLTWILELNASVVSPTCPFIGSFAAVAATAA